MCYNTEYEFGPNFDWDLVPFHDSSDRAGDNGCASEPEARCGLDLSQLLDRVARTSLQSCLQEMWLLFELF